MNLLEIRNLTLIKDNRPILNNLSMDIWAGHVHAIIGPNGAGKSTLANTIMGLSGYREFEGDILLEGESIAPLSVDERAAKGDNAPLSRAGPIRGPRRHAVHPRRGHGKIARCRGGSPPQGGTRAGKVSEASGRQNALGRRAQAHRARLDLRYEASPWLMDEPDSGVDIDSVKYIFAIIKELRRAGSTVILITHSPEVMRHADHAFLICAGTLVDKGDMSRMFDYFNGKCIPCAHVGQPVVDSVAQAPASA
jgi:Fe-S cluster assembly ATP-binding protein